MKPPRGFTIIEMLLVIAITVIMSVIALTNLSGRRSQTDLQDTAKEMVALLREAQSRSVSQSSSTSWGVHFENLATTSFFALFHGSYSVANRVNYAPLPVSVGYVTSTLNIGSTTEVTFAELSGLASASTTVSIQSVSQKSNTVTITVATSGLVSF